MTEPGAQEPGALDEVLEWNGAVHVFPRETISTRQDLKYLWVFPAAVLQVTAYVTWLYTIFKDHSGLLKPGIERIQETVTNVVQPFYQTIHSEHQHREILVFLDRKVDYVVGVLDGVLPSAVKELGWTAYDATKSTAAEIQQHGIYGTARAFFDEYEPVVESFGIQAYQKALTFPLVPEAVACSRFGAVKVNKIIVRVKETGLPLVSFLPLLPVSYFDKIARSG